MQHVSTVQNQANSILENFERILSYDPQKADNPKEEHRNLLHSTDHLFGNAFGSLNALISYLSSRARDPAELITSARETLNAEAARVRQLTEELAAKNAKADEIVDSMRKASGAVAVSASASFFAEVASKHNGSAQAWLALTFVSVVAFAVGAIYMIHNIPSGITEAEAIQLAFGKLVLFGALGYAIATCARNFHAHKHNQVVNEHRQKALETYRALVEAATGGERRDVILTHAAACIFGPQETGFTKSHGLPEGPASKVIEMVFPKSGGSGS